MFSNLKTLFCFNLKIRLSDEEREKNTRDADYDLEMRELTCKEDKLARDLEHKTETIADQDRQLVKMKELVDSVITEITIAENKVRDKTSENQDLLAEQDLARRQIGDLRSQVQNLLNENKEVLDQKSAVESIFEEKMKEASEIQKLECSKLRKKRFVCLPYWPRSKRSSSSRAWRSRVCTHSTTRSRRASRTSTF